MWPNMNGETERMPWAVRESKDREAQDEADDFWAEGPAVLRLRMLELKFGLRSRHLSAQARRDTEQALRDMRQAVLERPPHSFADLVAKLQTFSENIATDKAARRHGAIFG